MPRNGWLIKTVAQIDTIFGLLILPSRNLLGMVSIK